jgi:hypothetical protein
VVEVPVRDDYVRDVLVAQAIRRQRSRDCFGVVLDGEPGAFLRGPFVPRAGVHQNYPSADAIDGEQGPHDHGHAVEFVDVLGLLPENLGDDAEHGSAVEPVAAGDDGPQLETADPEHGRPFTPTADRRKGGPVSVRLEVAASGQLADSGRWLTGLIRFATSAGAAD